MCVYSSTTYRHAADYLSHTLYAKCVQLALHHPIFFIFDTHSPYYNAVFQHNAQKGHAQKFVGHAPYFGSYIT